MEKVLLEMTLAVEPDRQRFLRLVLEAVTELGGNRFRAAANLMPLSERLPVSGGTEGGEPPTARLRIHGAHLQLSWPGDSTAVTRLPAEPPAEQVDAVQAYLQQATRTTDPELLRQHNAEIARQLREAREHAAREMEELERDLAEKQSELAETIRQAETDALTGLINRGAFEKRLTEAVQRCHRQDEPLSLILLDLDWFKEINDTHGHAYGDSYLQCMAAAMHDAVRGDVDLCCRIGGDEFAIVAFADPDQAERMAERAIEAMDGKISAGLASLLREDTDATLFRRADRALYASKNAGRGRLTRAEDRQPEETDAARG